MRAKTVEDEGQKEEQNGEVTPKAKRESVERRKRLKKADRAARWSGFVLLLCVLLLGFLLWVVGEITEERGQIGAPTIIIR